MSNSPKIKSPVVVVIVASAGGVQALKTILHGLPKDFPAPMVIVQHRSMDSILADILVRVTSLRIADATEGELLKPGCVYISDPTRHLTVTDEGRFAYFSGYRIRHVLSSANPLFESSAEAFGSGVIGVVLTGGDHDGTDGVQTIKQHGGIVIAQNEESSEFFHMPASAIATGAVDYILPIDQIAPTLVRLVEKQRDRQPVDAR